MKYVFALMLTLTGAMAQADQANYVFRWQGANGYSLTGALGFDAGLLGQIVQDRDLTCFAITGFKDDQAIGTWSLGQLALDTTWRLHFDSAASSFLVQGQGVWMPQAWNMNGVGNDCGAGGFGFNIGSHAQDICVDGDLITQSQVPPPKPFPALRDDSATFPAGACILPDLLS